MDYFFQKKGSLQERGRVDEGTLRKMGQEGKLSPDDLICEDAPGREWVRARSLAGLCQVPKGNAPALASKKKAQPEATAPVTPPPVKPKARPPRRVGRVMMAFFLLAVLGGGAGAWWVFFRQDTAQVQETVPEIPTWEQRADIIERFVKAGDVPSARAWLDDWVANMGEDAQTAAMAVHLTEFPMRQRRDALLAQWADGRLDELSVQELLQLTGKLNETERLRQSLLQFLQAPAALNARKCRGAVTLARLLQDAELLRQATRAMALHVDGTGSWPACSAMLALYDQAVLPDEALALLETFVRKEPTSFPAWFELAARYAQAGRGEDAMNALRKLSDAPDVTWKEKTRTDARFDSIRDTWAFKRLVR